MRRRRRGTYVAPRELNPPVRAILTYHSIDSSDSVISVSEETFRQHVRFLGSGTVRPVTLAELLLVPPDEDAVAVTFDDAFENFGSVALPLLAEHGIPSTLFVVSGHVGRRNDWGATTEPGIPVLPLMSWEALGRAAERGVEIGVHTRRHVLLTRLPEDGVRQEVAGCAEEITLRLGIRSDSLAYPYGGVSDAVAGTVRSLVRRACTTELRTLGTLEDPMWLPRLDMYYCRRVGELEAWGSPAFRRRLWLRAQGRRMRQMVLEPWGAQ